MNPLEDKVDMVDMVEVEAVEFNEEDYRIMYGAIGKIPVMLDDPSYPKMVALRDKIAKKSADLNNKTT